MNKNNPSFFFLIFLLNGCTPLVISEEYESISEPVSVSVSPPVVIQTKSIYEGPRYRSVSPVRMAPPIVRVSSVPLYTPGEDEALMLEQENMRLAQEKADLRIEKLRQRQMHERQENAQAEIRAEREKIDRENAQRENQRRHIQRALEENEQKKQEKEERQRENQRLHIQRAQEEHQQKIAMQQQAQEEEYRKRVRDEQIAIEQQQQQQRLQRQQEETQRQNDYAQRQRERIEARSNFGQPQPSQQDKREARNIYYAERANGGTTLSFNEWFDQQQAAYNRFQN